MLGGGVFVTQNKVLPGSYINFVNTSSVSAGLGERGIVAIALPLGVEVGKVVKLTKASFAMDAEKLLGVKYDSKEAAPLREIFCNAHTVYVYTLGSANGKTVADALTALEPYEFNVLCGYSNDDADITAYTAMIETWRDNYGKKCQLVIYNQDAPDYEGIINVVSTVSDEGAPEYALTAWVAGAEAACALNASCTNALYNGEYAIVCNKTQEELEEYITKGQFAFHLVYGEIRVLEDVNSLTTLDNDKGEDFRYNQTIRVIDQIANDIAKLFNTKYLGKIPNNASGRVSLWADIVAHHRNLETLQAIEGFDSTLLTVEPGENKKSVVINDAITVNSAMAQLYMTVVVQ